MNKRTRIIMGSIAGVILVAVLSAVVVRYIPKKTKEDLPPADYVELQTSTGNALDEKSISIGNPVDNASSQVQKMKPFVEAVAAAVCETGLSDYESKDKTFVNSAAAYYMASLGNTDGVASKDIEEALLVMCGKQIRFGSVADSRFQRTGEKWNLKDEKRSVVANAYDYEEKESGYDFYVEIMNADTYQTISAWKVSAKEDTQAPLSFEIASIESFSPKSAADDTNERSDKEKTFTEELQVCVEDQDIEKLAGIVQYPVLLNGQTVADKEAFLALGKEAVFTDALVQAIQHTDADNLLEHDGQIMFGDGDNNIWFANTQDGCKVVGINNDKTK